MENKEVRKVVKKPTRVVKNRNFLLFLYNRIREGKNPSQIAKEYRIPRQNLYYYTKILKKAGVIAKHKSKNWYVLVKTFSLGTRATTNLHALQINIPISIGNIRESDWETKEKLKNWIPRYKKLSLFGGLTIKNNNNKSITIFANSRDIKDLKEIDTLSYNIREWATDWFWREFEVKLDIDRAEVKNLNIATEDKQAEGLNKKGEKFELDLDKKAEKILPKDKIDAKAWIDGSPFNFSAETNDKEWKRAYLNMPFNILGLSNSLPALEEYNRNLKLHIEVQEKQLETLKKIQESLEKK